MNLRNKGVKRMTDKDKVARDILSDITVHMKYARYLPKKERR